MDASGNLPGDRIKEESLVNCLQRLIGTQDLSGQREQVRRAAEQLEASMLDCAAALLYLCQRPADAKPGVAEPKAEIMPKQLYRSVRYRLDVGSQHQISREQIQAVLVEESGVDKKRIGRIEIRHNYTIVELPDGMPADIFQLLSEATVNGRKLAIKRVKANRRRVARESGEKR